MVEGAFILMAFQLKHLIYLTLHETSTLHAAISKGKLSDLESYTLHAFVYCECAVEHNLMDCSCT